LGAGAEIDHGGTQKRTQIARLSEQVDFAEDVDVRKLELEHGAQGEEEDGDVFWGVENVRRVHEVHGG